MDLLCHTSIIGGTPTLQLTGEIDLATLPRLHDALRRVVGEHRGAVIAVDLDAVTVLDDAGVGVLLGSVGRAREQGGDVVIISTSERLRQRFDMSGLSRAVEVRDRIAP